MDGRSNTSSSRDRALQKIQQKLHLIQMRKSHCGLELSMYNKADCTRLMDGLALWF